MSLRLSRRSFVGAGTTLVAPAVCHAQSALPERSLRIIVGFPNGGGSDLVARAIAPVIERNSGRRVSVESRPGNTGALAGETLKKAPPDGALVALLPTTTLSSKLLVPAWPIDPTTDFAPITTLGTFQTAIAASFKIPPTDLAQYVAWVKDGDASHQRLGLPATDAILEVYSRMVGRAFGVTLEGVPFRGAAPMIGELQDGRIPAAYGGVTSFVGAHRGARIRLLVCSGPQRLAVLKDVPTAAELGHPGMLMIEWYGVFARAGTPEPLITAWNNAFAAALREPEVSAQLTQLGVDVAPSTPSECAARLAEHLARWREVLQSLGIQPVN